MHRILVVIVVAVSAAVGLAGAAGAGGPTSVLITQPGQDAGALYYDDEAYEALLERLPADETTGKELPPGGGQDHNLTWLVHDVSAWRFDRVRTYPDGTAWVSTSFTVDASPAWEPLEESQEVAALLEGVLGDDAPDVVTAAPDAGPASAPAPAASGEPGATWFSLAGWRWVVPGALVGLLVGLVAGRRRPEAEPRRVLLSPGS